MSAIPVRWEAESERANRHANARAHRESFSRASHFAMALIPMGLGVAYILARDYFSWHGSGLGNVTDSIKLSLYYDHTIWLRGLTFAMWFFGVTGALTLLYGVSLLEALEKEGR